MSDKSTKPTQVEILKAIMGASQMVGRPIDASIKDVGAILEAIRTVDAATKALHKDSGGPLTSFQLLHFIAAQLGFFIGHQATEESKIPQLVVESTRVIIEAAAQTYQSAAKHKR